MQRPPHCEGLELQNAIGLRLARTGGTVVTLERGPVVIGLRAAAAVTSTATRWIVSRGAAQRWTVFGVLVVLQLVAVFNRGQARLHLLELGGVNHVFRPRRKHRLQFLLRRRNAIIGHG